MPPHTLRTVLSLSLPQELRSVPEAQARGPAFGRAAVEAAWRELSAGLSSGELGEDAGVEGASRLAWDDGAGEVRAGAGLRLRWGGRDVPEVGEGLRLEWCDGEQQLAHAVFRFLAAK
jgi:hypothetical protein